MAGSSFQFLHASDLHLGQPLGGMTEIPDELVDPLLDAPYQAFERVIDAALRERVEFVLLTGDLIHFPTASPRAMEFLRAQLERLQGKKIPAYWLDGRLECGNPFPDEFALPQNVQRLTSGGVHRVEVQRGKASLATLVARPAGEDAVANLGEMRCPRDGRLFVGLWYGDVQDEINLDQLGDIGIDYWACGGRSNPLDLDAAIPAQYCGTPQGRRPSEQGPHGCVLVEVDGTDVDTHFIETDVVRYQIERLELSGWEDQSQLIVLMSERLHAMRDALPDAAHVLLSWEIVGDGQLGRELRQFDANERMLARIQHELSDAAGHTIWTIGLRSSRTGVPSSLFDEDTILGDFVRIVRQMEQTGDCSLDVSSYLPDGPVASKLAESLQLDDVAAREQLLRDVATIGIDILRGD